LTRQQHLVSKDRIFSSEGLAIRPGEAGEQPKSDLHLIHLNRGCAIVLNTARIALTTRRADFYPDRQRYRGIAGIHDLIANGDRFRKKLGIPIPNARQSFQNDRLVSVRVGVNGPVVDRRQDALCPRGRIIHRI